MGAPGAVHVRPADVVVHRVGPSLGRRLPADHGVVLHGMLIEE